jgi:AcrR family transcriptional regulator
MRAPAWGGLPAPVSDTEARSRLVDAARRCFERFGFEKTSLSDVAAEAGVTRRTVYRYFDNTDELLRAAFALAAGGIVERMVTHARSSMNPGERIVDAMVFLCREMPADPQLGPLFSPGRDGARAGISSAVATEVSHGALRAVVEAGPNADGSALTPEEVEELTELILRLLQSFLTDPGPRARSEAELRAFFRRWLLPAIDRRATERASSQNQGN